MKKLIFIVILLLIILQTRTTAYAAEKAAGASAVLASIQAEKLPDNRAQNLKKILTSYNSPMADNADDFVRIADKYNLDWKLVAAIAGVESYFGQHVPYNSYNAWGWGVYGTQAIYFDSWRDGIFTVSEGLRKNYLNKGLNDPYAINKVYAASPTWGSHVSFFLNEIAKFQKDYETNTTLSYTNKFLAPVAGTSANLAFKLTSIDN
ncbi:MAG: hypothetical protein Q7R97_02995 [Candidatus Daviesbacteria bacterium]|nr:hypothetical protein [Candidatus Daviesbacteria bacterium]